MACWLVCLVCAGVGWSMRVRCIRGSRRVRSCWVLVWTGVWAGLATFASCALLLAYAVRMSRSDWAAVLAAAVRTPLAVFAGVMVASLLVGLLIRESQLFRFFKKR